MNTEERVVRLENAFMTLARLAENMDARVETQQSWINLLGQAQADSDAKIAALANAQIRTEDVLKEHQAWLISLKEAQVNSDAKFAELAEVQARLGEAQAKTEAAFAELAATQTKTEAAFVRLAEAQAHSDQRLDALIDIVREWRNGKSEGL